MEKILIDNARLTEFARMNGVEFLVLYGSYAKDNAAAESDVDVAVFFGRGHIPGNFTQYSEIVESLEKIFSGTGSRVDFVLLNHANILLRYEITSNGRLLFGDANDYEQYRAFAYREYCDAGPLFELEDFLLRKRQKQIQHAVT